MFTLGMSQRRQPRLLDLANLKNHYKLAKTGIKYVWNGTKMVRINPVVAIGSYVVETAIFLAWVPVVEDFLVGPLTETLPLTKLLTSKALSKAVIWQKSDSILEKAAGICSRDG